MIPMVRIVMWFLMAIVAGAAAVLSFSALRDLAIVCGFSSNLAWLLPVTIDAGAAAGTLVWRSGWAPENGRMFARRLTWLLLGLSVAGNAVEHFLHAYVLTASWWLVVMVSAIAPTVFGSVVHLAVLMGRTTADHQADQEPRLAARIAQRSDPVITERVTSTRGSDDWLMLPGEVPDQVRTTIPDRTADDDVLLADLAEWAARQGTTPTRNAVIKRYGIGATRANRLLNELEQCTVVDQRSASPDRAGSETDHAAPEVDQ